MSDTTVTRAKNLRQRREDEQWIASYLQEASKVIHATFHIPTLLQLVLSKSIELIGADQGCVLTLDEGVENPTPRFELGIDKTGKELREKEFALSSTVINRVLTQSTPVFSTDTCKDTNLKSATSIKDLAIRLVWCVPLIVQGEMLGLIYIIGDNPIDDNATDRWLHILTGLADQSAVALRQARFYTQIEAMYAKVRILDAAKDDFIQIISHELRTPLAIVAGYTGLLDTIKKSDGSEDTESQHIIAGLNQGVQRLSKVINSIIDVLEVDVGMNISRTPYPIDRLVQQVVERWQPAAKQRKLTITVETGENLVCDIDTHRVEAVIEQLIQNAVKFTPDGGHITVRVKSIDGKVVLEVQDTGIGIDSAYLEVIFEKFFRLDDVNHHSTGDDKFMGAGPGLGLYMARSIVQAHKGKLWAESDGEGKGSRFVVHLPM